jgi:hypothetical protein
MVASSAQRIAPRANEDTAPLACRTERVMGSVLIAVISMAASNSHWVIALLLTVRKAIEGQLVLK